MTKLENGIIKGKRMGIYNLQELACGCNIKSYIGGKVIVVPCSEHELQIYYKCPSCSKEFRGEYGNHKNGKTKLKEHIWSHAI